VETPLPDGLSEAQVAAAQSWADGNEGPGRNVIRQLQANLGVPSTGHYDRRTVIAVFNDQRAQGRPGRAGVASPRYMTTLGLIFTQDVVAAEVDEALVAQLQDAHSSGYPVAFYTYYNVQNSNNLEFERQATPYAERVGALGLQGDSVVQGVAVPVLDPGDLVEKLNRIYAGVRQHYLDALTPFVREIVDSLDEIGFEGGAPRWAKANDVALFCHGMPGGLSVHAGDAYRDGIHGDTYGESNVESFVNAVSAATTADVNVQLFSCSAGRGTDEDANWSEHRQDHRMGQQSFAQELSTHLGEEASVFAHTTKGHTTENYAARVFGAEAGGGEGGLHMFDRLYPESFIQSELERIYPSMDPGERDGQHDSVRERMWSHYRSSIGTGVPVSRYGVPMGPLMFQDPNRAAELLHRDWKAANDPS